MVRRQPSSDEEQQNGSIANGANLKVKMEKVKKEKMASAAARERERQDEVPEEEEEEDEEDEDAADGEEDEEEEDEDEEDDGEGSSRGRKRARVDEDGEARPVKPERRGRVAVQTLPRDKDGWVPGSIMRVQLRNFVTYDYTEFRCGPALNMILGPNGTGKSSIACAICLGLNWPPSVLGRATDLPSFVKIGQKDGHIEIELKGSPTASSPAKNLIIRRTLSASSKSSTFTLNGRSATGKEINAVMAALNVQVGNLCSFLPQDKVSEFAQMSPVNLLKETQRAAGDPRLSEWHGVLIESGKELKGVQELIAGEKDKLRVMTERNEEQERDVERFKTRQAIEQRIEVLEIIVPSVVYNELKSTYYIAKNAQRAALEKAKTLLEKNKPARNLLGEYEEDHKKLNRKRETAKKHTQATFNTMRRKWDESQKLDDQVEVLQGEIEQAKKTDKTRGLKIKNLEAQIEKWEHERANPPETEDIAPINDEMRALTLGRSEQKLAQAELEQRQREVSRAVDRENNIVNQCNQELQRLADKGHRKLEELRRWDPHMATAVLWLRQNKSLFKQEVFEPALLCMTVPNKRYASAVEACINANQMKTLVAQNKDDLDTLNRCLNDSKDVLKGGKVNTWFRPESVAINPPPMSPEEMGRLGFDGYAMDFIHCPEGLKSFLMRDVQLHRTAIGLDAQRVNIDAASAAVSRSGGAQFIAGNIVNKVQRSRYGRRATQNATGDLRPAKNFIDNSIDPAEQKRIDDKIKAAKTQLNVIEEESSQITTDLSKHKKDENDYHTALDALTARKKKVTTIQRRIESLAHSIVAEQDKLRALRAEPSAEAKAVNTKQKIIKLTKDRLKVAKGYIELMRSAIKDQSDMTRITLEHAQIGANIATLDAMVKERDVESNAANAAWEEAHNAFDLVKKACKEALDHQKAVLENASDELVDRYKALEAEGVFADKRADELTQELENERNNLELNSGANPGVVEQYERRKREIEALTATITGREKNAEKTERAIKNARDNWEPALEALVTSIGKKFSAAFDRIGCAGEIRISKHEDFDKWAIDILVKFREKEKLQLLTGQRQSGGERSLTTILYLMSLTEEARSPFSLVDEINQGMDMRAERAVHNSMVEVTCKPDSGQYFLITPKLLPDLNYHERMKVLCVNNGEWLPEERHIGSMMGMVEACAQRQTRSANAV